MKHLVYLIFVALIFLASCSDDTPTSNYNNTDAEEGYKVGNKLPNFILKNHHDKEFEFDKQRGKVLLFKYWSPTCGPCISSMPQTNTICEDYKSKNVKVITVSRYGGRDKWKENIEEYDMDKLENLFDENVIQIGNVIYNFGSYMRISGIPHYTIVDKYGVIQFAGNANQSSLISLIDELIKD